MDVPSPRTERKRKIPSDVIRTKEDILKLYNEVSSSPPDENGVLSAEISNTLVKRRMLKSFMLSGFLPRYYHEKRDNIQFWRWVLTFGFEDIHVTGKPVPHNEVLFWSMGNELLYGSPDLTKVKDWTYKNIEGYKRDALREGGSLGLYLCAPSLLYTSNRPKTDMAILRGGLSRTIKREDIQVGTEGENFVILEGEIWYVLPVTRYAAGMTKGLYFDRETPAEICGTFYYHEPESTTFLAYGKQATFFNKTVCSLAFDGEAKKYPDTPIHEHISGFLPADLMMTPVEAVEKGVVEDHYNILEQDTSFLTQKRYVGYVGDLYAAEDYLDQDICVKGKERGLDVIVLTHMVGMYQVVTEILDTRSRAESFNSLLYLE